MFTFNVPIAKLGFTIPVTVPTEAQLMLHAEHGLKQRLNDTTAGLKRKDFASDVEFNEAVAEAVDKVRVKVEAGTIGTRTAAPPKVNAKTLVEATSSVSDEEFVKILAALEEAKKIREERKAA